MSLGDGKDGGGSREEQRTARPPTPQHHHCFVCASHRFLVFCFFKNFLFYIGV